MATSRLQSLNCPICHELLDDQKILDCAHTFCVQCLTSMLEGNKIKCPLCREVTDVEDGYLSSLRINVIVSSLVDDLKNIPKCSAQEDRNHKENGVFFCYDCDAYFCTACFEIHKQLKPIKHHKTVTVEEHKQQIIPILTEKTTGNIGKDGNYAQVCADCNRFLTSPVDKSSHALRKHKVLSLFEYSSEIKTRAVQLQSNVTRTLAKIEAIDDSYATLEHEIRTLSYNMISQVNELYIEKEKQLIEWKLTLIKHCQLLQENVSQGYDAIEHKLLLNKRKLIEKSNLVGSNLIDNHNITAFAELCDNLSTLITTIDESARDDSLEADMRMAGSISLYDNRPEFGELRIAMWPRSTHDLKVGKNMAAFDTNRNGCIAIGYFEGGVEFYEDGKDPRIVLEDSGVLGIAFLRDSCLVVRYTNNKVQLFSAEMEPKDNTYETLTYEEGGDGCVAVDVDDNIYLSYRSAKKIQIFARKECTAIHEIGCFAYTPQQIAVLSDQKILVMDGSVITMFNKSGPGITQIMFPGCHGYPCVSRDGSVLVAWVDTANSLLRIDQYTKDLKVVRCVYSSNTVDLSGRAWYFLRELSRGALAFCTNRKVTIMRQESVGIK